MKKKLIFLTLAILLLQIINVNAASDNSQLISMSLVNQDPDPATAGNIVDVRVGILNMGGQSSGDVSVEFVVLPNELSSGLTGVLFSVLLGLLLGFSTKLS